MTRPSRREPPTRPSLPLPALVESLSAWQQRQSAARRTEIARALALLTDHLGLAGLRLRVEAPLLAPLEVGTGSLRAGPAGREPGTLRGPTDGVELGMLWVEGPEAAGRQAAHAVELVLEALRGLLRAERAEGNLAALDAAVAGIGGVLSLDRVLQLIVDNVRELAGAQFAALGIVGEDGRIERFHTAGLSAAARRRIGSLPQGRGLLGLIIEEGRAFRISDIATDARRFGFPPDHPEMHSFLGVPLIVRGRSVGNLYLTNKRTAPEFGEDDLVLVERFARHAALAIENARLGERVQALAVIEERERIGRDLHDGVIQHLYGVTLALDEVPEIVHDRPGEAAERVDGAITSLQGVIREIRDFIYGLARPHDPEDGLAAGAEALADELRAHAGLTVEVDVRGASGIGAETAAELLAIVREALSNVVRHAQASGVRVSSRRRAGDLVVEVADDGIGFVATPAGRRHHGLRNMERRTERLGGAYEVRSARGRGTRIIISVPVANERQR